MIDIPMWLYIVLLGVLVVGTAAAVAWTVHVVRARWRR